jgi:hypothetical protein
MAHLQPIYAQGSSITPEYENFVITTGDFTNGSNQFTIAEDSLVRVGQTLTYVNSQFTGIVTITNVSGTTITVDQNANSNAGNGQTIGLNTADGSYLIQSASFLDVNSILTVNSITGSTNSEYQSGDVVYSLLGRAAKQNGTVIQGKFHKYIVNEVLYRSISSAEISFFIEWGEDGTQTESGDKLFVGSNQTLPITQLTNTASLSPIFDKEIYPNLEIGSGFGGYQVELNSFFDTRGSGSGGVSTDTFPYTGSAEITGSLGVTGSIIFTTDTGITEDILLIKGNTADNGSVKVTSNGILQLAWSGSTAPSAIEGGIYYSSSAFYVGMQ